MEKRKRFVLKESRSTRLNREQNDDLMELSSQNNIKYLDKTKKERQEHLLWFIGSVMNGHTNGYGSIVKPEKPQYKLLGYSYTGCKCKDKILCKNCFNNIVKQNDK